MEIAGNLDFSFTSLDVEIDGSESADTNTKTLEISTLYYMAPNLGIGFEFFAENSEASSGGDSVEVKTLAIGPQVGANFPINDVTSFRLLGSVLLADIDVSNSFGDVEKADGLALGLSVGMSHFFAESVSLNGGLSYIKVSLDTKSSNLNVDIDGLRFGLGLSVYLR